MIFVLMALGFELLFLFDEVEGELFDFGHLEGDEFGEFGAVLFDLGGGGDAGEVAVGSNMGFDFGERGEAVVVFENVVGPAGLNDDFLGADSAVDG